MTITYNGHTYGHQQMWALVAALGDDGVFVTIYCGAISKPAVRLATYSGDDRTMRVLASGDPGYRTPFLALCRAVEKMQALADDGDER